MERLPTSSAMAPPPSWHSGAQVNAFLMSTSGFPPTIPYGAVTAAREPRPMLPETSAQRPLFGESPWLDSPMIARITIGALHDNTQLEYLEGMPLFVANSKRDLIDGVHAVYSLPNLNAALEAAAIARHGRGAGVVDGLMPPTPGDKRRRRGLYDDFPTTIDEFQASIAYLGWFNTSNEPTGSRVRNSSYAFGGRISEVANLWGDVAIGDRVGFIVKAITSRAMTSMDAHGASTGPAPSYPCLQVIPYSPTTCSQPTHSTRLKQPADDDLDFYETNVVQQTLLPSAAVGVASAARPYGNIDGAWYDVDAGGPKAPMPFVYQAYKQGLWYEVGRVTRRRGRAMPSAADISSACRGFKAFSALAITSTVDLELTTRRIVTPV